MRPFPGFFRIGAGVAFLLFSLPAKTQERNHDIVLDDYFSLSHIPELSVSPGGDAVAFSEARWGDENEARHKDLWIVKTAGGERTRLTFREKSVWNLAWGPGGEFLYFAAKFKEDGEEGKPETQVWRIRRNGTELNAVTRVKGGIKAFRIEAGALFYAVDREHTIDAWKDLRREFKDDVEFGHGIHEVSEIWRLDLESWRGEKWIDETRFIRSFDVSPDGSRIAMITGPDQHLITHEGWSEVDVYDRRTGKITRLSSVLWRDEAASPYGWLENPSWSPDGKKLAFTVSFDGYPTRLFVAEEGAVREVVRPEGAEVNGNLRWLRDGRLAFLADHRARERIFATDLGGNHDVLTGESELAHAFEVTPSGIVAVESGLDFNGDLFFRPFERKKKRLVELNPQTATWKLPRISSFKWQGSGGVEVEGILELPPDYEEGDKPLPTIIAIHGGPTASDYLNFRYWIYGRTAFAAKGFAVLSPNYRGSTGYGDAFMTDLIGRENDIEVEDILKGVDALVAEGIADPERLGVTGWSNGGYLTNCLIATNRFRAASSGAGVFDMSIQWGEEDTPGHVINYMDGLPWEKPEAYRKASPLYAFKPGITTATLIHVGANDARVPVTHSRALHRALHHYIEAPCELLIYPGAGHGLTEFRHRLAKLKWDHAWFEKYLLGGGD